MYGLVTWLGLLHTELIIEFESMNVNRIIASSVVTVSHWPRSVGFGSVLGKNHSFSSVWFGFLTSTENSAKRMSNNMHVPGRLAAYGRTPARCKLRRQADNTVLTERTRQTQAPTNDARHGQLDSMG